ncbi:amino acid dehydrogenase [Endozoicomonas sp. OPT23]|uniref:NAD(P)/FAD-dependent oxidoreductase n=1 Tax=Endozoicomonas sp. OPT23 TaxID=2072845 RepID=UPI00129AD549|nr:FAD-dependent oxidoreductase [Endozoicomonas sp. OPT23]MRI32638.1 amino acid dehydrogenase [Endozoicomonas sp. OPT23]
MKHVCVVGAGIVGLSTALSLQSAGFKVTLIDSQKPGLGTSFGNAGLFADYARLPFASFSMLKQMPGMLLDSTSPLRIDPGYTPKLIPYGLGYIKACLPENYRKGRQLLTDLQKLAPASNQALFNQAKVHHLVKKNGCLALYSSQAGYDAARAGHFKEREEQGVNFEFLSAEDIRDLEPDLQHFYHAGVNYSDVQFSVDPLELSKQCFQQFLKDGGIWFQKRVESLGEFGSQAFVNCGSERLSFDHLVVAAGEASGRLLNSLGNKVPLVSERGYHLMLQPSGKTLSRPVGWLDKSVFITPMEAGLRIAGTAEFAKTDAAESSQCVGNMLAHAQTMLGEQKLQSSWVGSRPSTPDSLPIIGPLSDGSRIILASGHGHLGLTLAAVTAQLVTDCIFDRADKPLISGLSIQRFS